MIIDLLKIIRLPMSMRAIIKFPKNINFLNIINLLNIYNVLKLVQTFKIDHLIVLAIALNIVNQNKTIKLFNILNLHEIKSQFWL